MSTPRLRQRGTCLYGLQFRTATHIGSGGAGGFLHFVLCHAFHQHERHEACPHHEEGSCHRWHLRWEVSPLHGKACATTAHTSCSAGQRAEHEQIASVRGLRTRPVPEKVQVSVRCVQGMGSLCARASPIVQLVSSLEPALSGLEGQVGIRRDFSLAACGGQPRHFANSRAGS